METIYVVRGRLDGPSEVWPDAVEGQPEWQFSDGPPGERGSSADFLDLREGLKWAKERGAVVDFTYADLDA